MRPSALSGIHLYSQPVDMRKSFEGLSLLVDTLFPGKLLTDPRSSRFNNDNATALASK